MDQIKFEGPFAGIRELLKHVDHIRSIGRYQQTGILKVVLAGRVVITDEIIEAMNKSGYKLKIYYNSVDPELIDSIGDFQSEIQNEDDVPDYMCTNLLLKDTEPLPLSFFRDISVNKIISASIPSSQVVVISTHIL